MQTARGDYNELMQRIRNLNLAGDLEKNPPDFHLCSKYLYACPVKVVDILEDPITKTPRTRK